jgi:hypothetical protein
MASGFIAAGPRTVIDFSEAKVGIAAGTPVQLEFAT